MTKTARKIKKWIVFALRASALILVSTYYLITVLIRGEKFTYHPAVSVCLFLVGLQFLVDLVLKLFGCKYAPVGAVKHLKANYLPTGVSKTPKNDWKATFTIALLWGVAVATFGLLKFFGILDEGLLVLAFLALCVLDGLSIHFFCPFRVFVMKNKCCTTCRIYNWDGLMITSPLYFVHNIPSFIVIGVAFVLFLWWEIVFKMHPERFFEETNATLKCSNCKNSNCPRKNKC